MLEKLLDISTDYIKENFDDIEVYFKRNVKKIRKAGREELKPPPEMTGSEYADKYGFLPPTDAIGGRFRTSAVPHTKFILNACSHPKVRVVSVRGSAQGAKTTSLIMIISRILQFFPTGILLGFRMKLTL